VKSCRAARAGLSERSVAGLHRGGCGQAPVARCLSAVGCLLASSAPELRLKVFRADPLRCPVAG